LNARKRHPPDESALGLVNPANPCRYHRRLKRAVDFEGANGPQLLFPPDRVGASKFPNLLAQIRRLEGAQRAVALFRSNPE
jgi:hypothetical protein